MYEEMQGYFTKLEEIIKLDEDIKQYRNKMEKELAEERVEIKGIILRCNSREEIVNILRTRAMKSDIRNNIYIGLHLKQLSMLKEMQNMMNEMGMNDTNIPEIDNMIDSVNEMITNFENKIKIMTEGLQQNSLTFNEFLTNSLNV